MTMTETRGRYANGQLVKVLQTATIAAVLHVDADITWRSVKTTIESRSLTAVKKYEFTARGHTLLVAEISYTARGANRTDIVGRLERDFGDQLVDYTYGKTVQHD